ncbi:amidase [Chelatococcus asaccharovorans]|uniref:Indoleacetamide hydrolase n=1 Tax=Chelatococcus asaccharovorans TaxID=28210 RepID=A0A2V3U143_9HYPH|nr:amidase [Chelatococcus asaccharovorans]MBS7707752.1 amidase [Chelatococcus asaccharovorans]PXW55329.1 aspartyl-tRNA(Asn)/glutamyl-tRNA(Gln) amidotransferase subunit A [Chelatococcus asaccharovorans]
MQPQDIFNALFGRLEDAEIDQLVRRWQIMQRWLAELDRSPELPPPDTGVGAPDFSLPPEGPLDSITGLTAAFTRRDLSPVDHTAGLLDRIERLDDTLHSHVTVTRPLALAAARTAELCYRDGAPRGPLDGVPFNLKDIIDVAAVRTTCQSRLRLDVVATRDAPVVAALLAAGAVLTGKSATHEFAFGGPTDDVPFPQPRNPWDRQRYAGGSSSGAAVALAAGLGHLAVGSDTGGSLRIPAAHCGVVSLKPTRDRISTAGVVPLAPPLDHVGPLARSVADCAQGFGVMVGAPAAAADRDLAGLTIGIPYSWLDAEAQVAPCIRAAMDQMGQLVQSMGARLRGVLLPHMACFRAVVSLLTAWGAWQVHGPSLRARYADHSDVFRWRVAPAALLQAQDYARILAAAPMLVTRFRAATRGCDLLLTPATATTAPLLAGIDALADPLRPSSFLQVANLTGHPALTIRAGFDTAGLPIGLQLVGRHGADEALLAAGAAIEAAMPRRPRPDQPAITGR